MKKVLFLFAWLVAITTGAFAQPASGLCIVNDGPCDLYVAMHADCATAGYASPNVLRADIIIPAGMTKCFTDYDDYTAPGHSHTGWWAAAVLPPATEPSFRWLYAELQYQECDPIGGCGTDPGIIPPYISPAVSSCMTSTFTVDPMGNATVHAW